MDENKLFELYEQKLRELNSLRDGGHLAPDEYRELVKDFTDVEAIKADIEHEDLKIFAEMIVNSLKPQVQKL